MTGHEGSLEVWCLGSEEGLAEALKEQLAATVHRGPPPEGDREFTVVVQAYGPLPEAVGGNAFALCQSLKERRRGRYRVFLVLRRDDPYSAEIARFCLADGCLVWSEDRLTGVEKLREIGAYRPKVSLDDLLSRLEKDLETDGARRAVALRRLLDRDKEKGLLEQLTEPETGLFDGPFASFKLDEEFRRAARLHQPLSLILLDIGGGGIALPVDPQERRTFLAEVSAVFLNQCRDIDTLARFTETIFLFLLPGTGNRGAVVLARRMIEALTERPVSGQMLDPRVGIATVPCTGIGDRKAFLAVAEQCLEKSRLDAGDGSVVVTWE